MGKFLQFYNLLTEYNENRLPKLFSTLNKYNNKSIGVHFSKSEYVQTNPKPFHHDPLGVYAFPIDYVLKGGLERNRGFVDSEFIHILEPNEKSNVLNLSKLSNQDAQNILEKMGIPGEYLNDEDTRYSGRDKPGNRLWGAIERWRNDFGDTRNSSWNALFKKSGFNTIVDEGDSAIHSNEPAQILFLQPGIYNVLETIKKDMPNIITQFIDAFPDRKIRRVKSYGGGDSEYVLDKKGEPSLTVIVKNSEYNVGDYFVRVDGTDEEFKKYLEVSETPVSKAISEVKEFLSKNGLSEYIKDSKNKDELRVELLNRIAETFNLKRPTDEMAIKRIYEKNGKKYKLLINGFINDGDEYLSLSVERNRSYGFDNFYLYAPDIKIENGDIRDAFDRAFNEMLRMNQENVDKAEKRGEFEYGADDAEKFIKLLRQRVFKLG